MFKFSASSLKKLEGVHPKLVCIALEAIQLSTVDFKITEGLRTFERQKELVARGASKTMKSKHLNGRAIDVAAIVNGTVNWNNAFYAKIRDAMFEAACNQGVEIVWGGDWKGFVDACHFELGKDEQ